MMQPTCLVMMGTYNGEKFLREQLDSILAQEGVSVALTVSDDCSTDGTVAILQEYAQKSPNVTYKINERNKNFTYNFLDLLFSVKDTEFDYYAFADQDDVWQPKKLKRAIEVISRLPRRNQNGAFYCSNLIVTDCALNRIGMMEGEKIQRASRKTFCYENIATGCTIVFDRAFLKHATSYYPKNIFQHDYWLFLIAAYTAEYVYDENGYIFYRQHGNNQIGQNSSLLKKAKHFKGYHGAQSALARELLIGFGDYIEKADGKRLKSVRDGKKFKNRLKIFFCGKCHTVKKTFALKVKAVFGKL